MCKAAELFVIPEKVGDLFSLSPERNGIEETRDGRIGEKTTEPVEVPQKQI